ncbi:Uncharacterised protein [Acinetobacter baumannii]|uniref:hypothetical protein n=1 Tax=Acinetobacter baumannii TaxID=470 RepID=UPI000D1EC51A|nr:hypothetical protein [Acinetobacter baumannii]SSS87857.1 Uncharacterised protein [Acinetobacter baumannii]
MNQETLSLVISITGAIVSIATFSIAYSQMKIASAKTKLDLYNKRFNIYAAALDYYQATWYESPEKIQEKSIIFTKLYRESQFLFEESDGVYATLGKIQQNGAQIYAYEKKKHEIDPNLTKTWNSLDEMHRISTAARFSFEENLKALEKQLDKYLQFKTISGWKLF